MLSKDTCWCSIQIQIDVIILIFIGYHHECWKTNENDVSIHEESCWNKINIDSFSLHDRYKSDVRKKGYDDVVDEYFENILETGADITGILKPEDIVSSFINNTDTSFWFKPTQKSSHYEAWYW